MEGEIKENVAFILPFAKHNDLEQGGNILSG